MNLTLLGLVGMLALDPIPVVISSDCGCEMDDQWAIAHLCLAPSISVRAIITAHAPKFAPPASETSATAARAVLNLLPPSRRPPVIAGANLPLVDRKSPRPSKGADRLVAESKGFTSDRRLTVVQIGPATDVASGLLIDPTLADRIAVVAMAFDGWPKGGDPFNVRNDVAAWQVLINSTVPLTVVDAAVSLRNLTVTREQAAQRFAGRGTAGRGLVAYQTLWLDRQSELARAVTGSTDAWPVWDCGTVAVLLGFAEVVEHPRPRLRDDRTFDHIQTNGTIRWVSRIDGDRLWDDFASLLAP